MEQHSQDVKIRILNAAKKLFAQHGFDATTVRQICEEAGANVALVSYHFGGKENVFYALLEAFYPKSKMVEYEKTLQDPVAGIKLIIREVIRFRREDPEMATVLQREIVTLSPRSEIIQKYIFPVWLKLRELLEVGRNQNLFHFRSLDQTLLFVLGVILFPKANPFLEPLLVEGEVSFELQVEDTQHFVFNGLGYRETP